MRIENITYPDINNGLGCRLSLWISGCTHRCPQCQNKQTWDFNCGNEFNDNIFNDIVEILKKPYIKGLTLTGGDPLDSFEDVYDLVIKIKSLFPNKDIWLYTGYKFNEIINDEEMVDMFNYIDYVVDDVFIHEKRDVSLKFRGSSNQTIWEKNKDGEWFISKLND